LLGLRMAGVGRGAAILLAGALFAWGAAAMGQAAALEQRNAPPPTIAAPAQAALASTPDSSLPRAWATPDLTHTPTPTPSPTATATGTALVQVASPSATPSPSITPTPTATPIHAPASADPSRITIPAINLDTKVITVGIKEQYQDGVLRRVWDVADYAAGFHKGMARPGHEGNTVISGHNNIRGSVFENLHKLKPGDEAYVWVGNSPYRYRVSATYRLPIAGAPPDVLQDNIRFILPTQDQRLTLTTCWPPWSNTHRTVVVAYPDPWE